MTKQILIILSTALLLLWVWFWSTGDYNRWWEWWSDPMEILDEVVGASNDWNVNYQKIQDTALDDVSNNWSYNPEYRITNTLDWIRWNITIYLQWIVFIWLWLATILIIYNGFMLVTHWIHWQWDMAKFKSNMINIAIWVVLLLWFYFLIELILALITVLFGNWSWKSWAGL